MVDIQSIFVEYLSKPETTYNFEVEDYHTYYVTQQNILCHNKCPGGDYYRGSNDFTARESELRFDRNGLVKDTHGVSVNKNPLEVLRHGVPHKVIDMPEGLKIVQRGVRDILHYEIIPSYPMPLSQFQDLLSQIVAIPWI